MENPGRSRGPLAAAEGANFARVSETPLPVLVAQCLMRKLYIAPVAPKRGIARAGGFVVPFGIQSDARFSAEAAPFAHVLLAVVCMVSCLNHCSKLLTAMRTAKPDAAHIERGTL
mmetsp:Transcript_146087/g.269560  ORF Transcript_146087/g.269560 Transcript_146087/m.269560 type:complete len:115 (+) Transcript_146087:1115-1459(+)